MTRWGVVLLVFILFAGCGGGSSSNTPGASGPQIRNVISISVSGSGICSGAPNNPCVQVTVCQPGTTNCQIIPDILVDTGSLGLRIFGSALNVPLTQTTDSQGRPIGECAAFADLTVDWGPVKLADVVLGNEPAVTVPIQVIDPTFGGGAPTTTCASSGVTVNQTPTQAASNGILGVNFFPVDAGPYFSCSTTCTPFSSGPSPTPEIPLNPVQNPVFLLPVDYNGIVLTFPSVPANGAPSVTGSLTFGIGTAANNSVGPGVFVYPASTTTGTFTTLYPSNGTTTYRGIIDSGTNGIAVPDPNIQPCPANGPFNGFLCPASTLALSASNLRADGTFQPLSFQIANTSSLDLINNNVFNNLGLTSTSSAGFFWGLPFFLGRTVYLGYDQTTSPLGTGPLWAY